MGKKYRYIRNFSVAQARKTGVAWRDLKKDFPDLPDCFRPSRAYALRENDPWDDINRTDFRHRSWKKQSKRPRQWKVRELKEKSNHSAGYPSSIMVKAKDWFYFCKVPSRFRVGTKYVRRNPNKETS